MFVVDEYLGIEASQPEYPGSRLEAQMDAFEADLAGFCGLQNAMAGRLVAMTAAALEQGWWEQWGLHSPAHWLAWQTGASASHAQDVVGVAKRYRELPQTMAALEAGEISFDTALVIARKAPATHEATVLMLAREATVSQLSRVLRRYKYNPEGEAAKPKPKDRPESFYSSQTNDDGTWDLRARLSAEQGAVLDRAVRTAKDNRYRQLVKDLPAEAERPKVTLADGLAALGEAHIAANAAAHPGSGRNRINYHLQANPVADGGLGLELHLGPVLPDALRRFLLCDAVITPIWEHLGTPVSVGRDQRVVNHKQRALVEHRDQGCRVPGCRITWELQIHHIRHWEDGGHTNLDNLVSLCSRHHRLHHQGLLAITGNPNLKPGKPGALKFKDRWGNTLEPHPQAQPPPPGQDPGQQAKNYLRTGINPYQHAPGERLHTKMINLDPTPGRDPGRDSGPNLN